MEWTFGLVNHNGKYLTAETFGFGLTANAPSLKKKQIFVLEESDGKVYIRTQTGRYISAPEGDKITADAEQKSPSEGFTVVPQSDGRWAFKTVHGTFLGGDNEKLDCFTPKMTEATLTPDRLWTMQLAMHPQIAIRSSLRKQYAHLDDNAVTTDEDIPWGADATITLNFSEGKYAFETFDGRFLSADGSLKGSMDASTLFVLVITGNEVSFLSPGRGYLTVTGGRGKLNASRPIDAGISKNELFTIEDSHPQLKFTNVAMGKKVTVGSGVQAQAKSDNSGDTETLQLEVAGNGRWKIRSNENKLLYIDGSASVMTDGDTQSDAAEYIFKLEFDGPRVAIIASNGKYVGAKKNGALVANLDGVQDESAYVFEIVNRPKLVLRSPYGFLATNQAGQVRCNNVNAEVFALHVSQGNNHVSALNGRYLAVNAAGVGAEGSSPEDWHIEFVGPSKLAIKVGDRYLQSFQNGDVKATGSMVNDSTTFEY